MSDGQAVLELGCGWGSMSLYVAAAYPNSSVTAVSNSKTQREFIMGQAEQRGLKNVQVGPGRRGPEGCAGGAGPGQMLRGFFMGQAQWRSLKNVQVGRGGVEHKKRAGVGGHRLEPGGESAYAC